MNTVTIVGNITRDPELRYTQSGNGLATFGLAVNTRRKDARGNWVDGDPQFYDVTVWGEYGENVAESVYKGDRVIVAGKLQYRTWEADDGSKRSAVSIVAEEVGPSLRWATLDGITRTKGTGGQRSATKASPGTSGGGFYDDDEEMF
jgi:single-strand DNA-binding protein